MAATVGAAFPNGSIALRHANVGPFLGINGAYYCMLRGGSAGNALPQKATDPMSAFAAQTTSLMSSATSTPIEAMACAQGSTGSLIHVATQISTGAVYYNRYDTSTDTWLLGTSEVAVAAPSFAPVTNTTFVDLIPRSNGEVVIVYNAGQTAMTSTFNMVRYVRRTGTNTYSAAVNVDNGGSVNWLSGVCGIGASDRVHFFLVSATGSALYQRTLSAANALQTFPASSATFTPGSATGFLAHPRTYVDTGTTKVRAGFYGASGLLRQFMLDSADTPTVTSEAISENTIKFTNVAFVADMAIDSTTVHALYSDNTINDLFHDSSASGGGAWGTDINELAATINHVSANVYDRSGTKLGMMLDDAGTGKYAEIALVAAAPAVKNRPIISRAALVRSHRY